jgi:hypothetical protein
MKLDFAFLCEHVAVGHGSVSALNIGLHTLQVSPSGNLDFSMVVQINFGSSDASDAPCLVTMRVVDSAGEDAGPHLSQEIDSEGGAAVIGAQIKNARLLGDYSVIVTANDTELTRIPFSVEPAEA